MNRRAMAHAPRNIVVIFWCLLVTVVCGQKPETLTPVAQRITQDGLFKQRPVWSPDGSHVVFARHEGSKILLYARNLADGSERRLTKGAGPEYDAIFSPDGSQLLFSFDKTSPNQGDLEVHRVGFDDPESKLVVGTAGKLSHEEWACWSPDGKRIALTSTRDGNQELYVALADGSQLKRLTSNPAIDAHPTWSPDGETIVFATNRWGDLELAAIQPDGSGLKRLTESPGLDDYPAWSRDGKQIAFTSNRDGNFEIYVCDPDGSNAQNVTKNVAIDNFPTWTPTGELGFVSNRDGGFDIYVLKKRNR